jgi:hypothetical protein
MLGILNPARVQRREELVAQIASQRDAVASVWNQMAQRMVSAQYAWRLVDSARGSPLLIGAVVAAIWVIGPRRGLLLLKGIASDLRLTRATD